MLTRLQKLWPSNDEDIYPHSEYNLFLGSGKQMLQKLAYGFVPSFLQRRISPKARRLHATSYLDGLRGVAALIVFMGHYTEENIGWWAEPYGLYETEGAASSPIQLPVIRVLFAHRPMVHIFFVISGFVLVYKPMKQIHSHQYSAFESTLSSSVFRRGIRLLLPSFVSFYVAELAVHYHIASERFGPALPTLSAQLTSAYEGCWDLVQRCWKWDDKMAAGLPQYNPVLWSIPVEFVNSLFVFITIIGISHVRKHLRLLTLAFVMAIAYWSAQLDTTEFLCGMFIAEIVVLQSQQSDTPLPQNEDYALLLPASESENPEENSPPAAASLSPKTSSSRSVISKIITVFWILNVICALFICSWTNTHEYDVPFIKFLITISPRVYKDQRMWFGLAAFQIVFACTQLPFLQRLFNHRLPQYLGNISFGLYLVHYPLLASLEPRFAPIFDKVIGKDTFWGRHCSWLAGLLIYGPVIFWFADAFWRAVDAPTVRFAKWVEGVFTEEKGSES